jgi:hypothetical protein
VKFLSLSWVLAICALVVGINANAAGSVKVIRLVAVQVSQKPTKAGFVIRDNDFSGKKKVGHDTLTCTVVSKQRANCRVVIVLTAGTLTGTVPLIFSRSQGTGLITSGTGSYSGSKGKLAYRNLNEQGTRTALVITLT